MSLPPEVRRSFLRPSETSLSKRRQAELLGVSRSSLYYAPKPKTEDLRICHLIDQIYTDHPFYGSRRIRWVLQHEHNIPICREHVQRLMRLMGIQGICPKVKTSIPAKDAQKYPYLLRNLAITEPNQTWGTDITYIPLSDGFCYLVALLDWFSRYVLAWEVAATMEVEFCARALQSALRVAIPDIHNSDQGAQFTSQEYTGILKAHPSIRISMDGRGRCMDNIFTERLWRSVKYEEIYVKHYETIDEVREGLALYFSFYNTKRPHQALNYRTPADVYFGR